MIRHLIITVGCAALVTTPAPAQRLTQPGMPSAGRMLARNIALLHTDRMAPHDTMKTARAKEVASCLLKTAKADASSLIGGPLTEDKRFIRLVKALRGKYRNCRASTELPRFLISSSLAEELLRTEQRSLNARQRSQKAVSNALSHPSDIIVIGKPLFRNADITMDDLGSCLIRHSPDLAEDLVCTLPATKSEELALARLYAKTPQCRVRSKPNNVPEIEQRSAVVTALFLQRRT